MELILNFFGDHDETFYRRLPRLLRDHDRNDIAGWLYPIVAT